MRPLSSLLFVTLHLTYLLAPCAARSPQCDPRTKPPTKPSFQDCQTFLWNLAERSHKDPHAYKWYGSRIEPCAECVKLPTIIHWKNFRSAALIDVDDEDEQDIGIFGYHDLWKALSDIVGDCWLKERHNGRGYPSASNVWAALIRGVSSQPGATVKRFEGTNDWGNRTLNVLDLEELYPATSAT